MTLYTTAQVASLIKRTKVTVLRRAQSRKMRPAVRGLQWHWTAAQARKLGALV